MPTSIAVTFVDQQTGQPFAHSNMPIEQLPPSFATATQLTIADTVWQVVTAEPLTAEEFAQTGKLTLTLAKIEYIPPKDILFSLPTITNALPGLAPGTSKTDKHILTLHEDDWRQIELVSASYSAEIQEQFEGIRRIFSEKSTSVGFTALYVRKLIEPAIVEPLTQHELVTALPTPFETFETCDGIAYRQSDELIVGGFAYDTDAVALYGVQDDGLIEALGLYPMRTADAPQIDALAEALTRLMAAHDLVLIDWCRTLELAADAPAISAYLANYA